MIRFARLALCLAVLAAPALFVGCSSDEPAPAPAPAAGKEAPKDAAKPDAAKPDAAKPDAAKPAPKADAK